MRAAGCLCLLGGLIGLVACAPAPPTPAQEVATAVAARATAVAGRATVGVAAATVQALRATHTPDAAGQAARATATALATPGTLLSYAQAAARTGAVPLPVNPWTLTLWPADYAGRAVQFVGVITDAHTTPTGETQLAVDAETGADLGRVPIAVALSPATQRFGRWQCYRFSGVGAGTLGDMPGPSLAGTGLAPMPVVVVYRLEQIAHTETQCAGATPLSPQPSP